MPRFKFGKLVRDKIVENQLAGGAKPDYKVLDDEAHVTELIKKIIEEAREVLESSEVSMVHEIADLQQVIDDLKTKCAIADEEVQQAMQKKLEKSGGFLAGHYIESVEVADGDPWVEHFRENADRYPEI